jgi:hypothetical protein
VKTYLELFFRFLMCRNIKYILQKSTHKIKQLVIQLAINQFFQKVKSRSTNKQTVELITNPPSSTCPCELVKKSSHCEHWRIMHADKLALWQREFITGVHMHVYIFPSPRVPCCVLSFMVTVWGLRS